MNIENLKFLRKHCDEMLSHVLDCLPEEACGLVASSGNVSKVVYPITNELHSSIRYRMDPTEQLNAFLDMEKRDWSLAGIFHSHPNGPSTPSETDLSEFAYPGVLTLIWSPAGRIWSCKSFLVAENKYMQKDLEILDGV